MAGERKDFHEKDFKWTAGNALVIIGILIGVQNACTHILSVSATAYSGLKVAFAFDSTTLPFWVSP